MTDERELDEQTIQTAQGQIFLAYLQMAGINYRAQAPDPEEQVAWLPRTSRELKEEAWAYADKFIQEENTRNFRIGKFAPSNYRALVYTIEAARLLCGPTDYKAVELLKMACEQAERAW